MNAIKGLIGETWRWHKHHKDAGRFVEASACRIRIRALEDALDVLSALTTEGE